MHAIPAFMPTLASPWSEQDLRSTLPTHEIPNLAPTRALMREIGFDEDDLAELFVNPKTETILVDPKAWFWTDRKWWKHTRPETIDKMYRVAGGCFAELSLSEQAAMLGLEIEEIAGRPSRAGRGMWVLPGGPVGTVEDLALAHYRERGYSGTASEGKALNGINLMNGQVFQRRFGHWLGFDETNQRQHQPGPEYAAKVLLSAREVLANVREVYNERKSYYLGLLKAPIEEIEAYIATVGPDHILRCVEHRYVHGATVFSGHFDLTLRGESLRFVEVKAKDRLHANQADWVRSVARPLGLDASIARVVKS
ncbi:hypothetical protein [Bosea sp. ANAM02]|uniref:hypothetical protein n=1 Tax=Bosea sp. ANAM02 TaxID=2020412 RepID=UPI00140EF3E6|nr:hypothetical protein [Bosea sp. ANAM02]BCB22354.1 hypothetical protein OCUBac02_52480 [Bosea sp. ANAM02]